MFENGLKMDKETLLKSLIKKLIKQCFETVLETTR